MSESCEGICWKKNKKQTLILFLKGCLESFPGSLCPQGWYIQSSTTCLAAGVGVNGNPPRERKLGGLWEVQEMRGSLSAWEQPVPSEC